MAKFGPTKEYRRLKTLGTAVLMYHEIAVQELKLSMDSNDFNAFYIEKRTRAHCRVRIRVSVRVHFFVMHTIFICYT